MAIDGSSTDEVLRDRAIKRLKKRRDFAGHVLVYLLVNGVLVLIWALTDQHGFFWPLIPMAFWGIGVVMNAWDVFHHDFDEEQIQHEMERFITWVEAGLGERLAITVRVAERSALGAGHRQGRFRPRRRPRALWPLLVVMGFLSLGGFVGGVSFVVDRTGGGLGAKPSWLQRTPVNDFLLPGLLLLGLFGLGSVILMAGLVWRFSPGPLHPLDRRLGLHWSAAGTVGVGAVLVVWILYEFAIIPERMVLQPVLIAVGVLMVAIPLLPSMRGYVATRTDS